ncbi:MAG TPA: hypothetical protein PKE14_09665 [Chitinophagales bacterium]|nr:hypothetical protein [Chitinophagales bacterium]
MKNLWVYLGLISLSALGFSSCQQSANGSTNEPSGMQKSVEAFSPGTEWNNYWYSGKAELTSYTLQQSRYGEIHAGTAVNIFVTEDFSKSKHVKLDDPSKAGADKLPVLKMNQSIKFNTGIYPYSIMLSSFQPVDVNQFPHAVKISGTVQEWCGMAYYQLDQRDEKYQVEVRSYFESEGDKELSLPATVQEDALWNMIRIAPANLPTGEQMILPGATYLRLSHKPVEAVKSQLTLQIIDGVQVYTIKMPSLNRELKIRFESAFPYHILGWEDTYPGFDGVSLTTTAVRNKEMIIDYWRTHNNADRVLREQLGLPKDTQ